MSCTTDPGRQHVPCVIYTYVFLALAYLKGSWTILGLQHTLLITCRRSQILIVCETFHCQRVTSCNTHSLLSIYHQCYWPSHNNCLHLPFVTIFGHYFHFMLSIILPMRQSLHRPLALLRNSLVRAKYNFSSKSLILPRESNASGIHDDQKLDQMRRPLVR